MLLSRGRRSKVAAWCKQRWVADLAAMAKQYGEERDLQVRDAEPERCEPEPHQKVIPRYVEHHDRQPEVQTPRDHRDGKT